jgi:sulfopyruvate decarboxylase subunit alpha
MNASAGFDEIEKKRRTVLTAKALESGKIIYGALKEAGVTTVLYLPDSTTYPIQKLSDQDPEMPSICCSREDEAVAIAGGIAFAGGFAAVVMDSSGLGWSAYILSECLQYRTPMLILSSHTEALGEARDYHNVARAISHSVYEASGIPYTVLMRLEDAALVVEQSIQTARGVKMPVGIVLPNHVMGGK